MSDNEQNSKHDNYRFAVDLLIYEGQMLWQIITVFMLAHTILIGFIANMVASNNEDNLFPIIIMTICGFILLFPWMGTFLRNSEYYEFRMSQAKSCEPKKRKLLRVDGENFSQHNQVVIGDKKHQIKDIGKWMKNKSAIRWLIYSFGIIYLSLAGFVIYPHIFFKPVNEDSKSAKSINIHLENLQNNYMDSLRIIDTAK